MTTTRMTSKGQVVIPAAIRRCLGIGKGTPMVVDEKDGAIILRPATREYFDRLAGVLPGEPSLAKQFAEEHVCETHEEHE